MPLGVPFAFDTVWALEFIRKEEVETTKQREEEEVGETSENNVVYDCVKGSSRAEITFMISDALAEFGQEDDSWIVVVKCLDSFGSTMNYPLSISHFAQAFYLQQQQQQGRDW